MLSLGKNGLQSQAIKLMSKTQPPPVVLVADDQPSATLMLQRVFEYEGYQVVSVHDGLTALESATSILPDLILLDINMPSMNGFDVLKRLREIPATASIPTILITAMGEWPDIVQGLQLGADDYVRKPFHPRELLARAQSKMKARKLEDTLQRRTQDLEALLRVSEALNQRYPIADLLELIVFLVIDLLPGDVGAIYKLDDKGKVIASHVMSRANLPNRDEAEIEAIVRHLQQAQSVQQFLDENRSVLWPDDVTAPKELPPHGIATPMRYADTGVVQAVLLITGQAAYDSHHLQLLDGIGRQANLALRNAELYEIQEKYALHLKDMVDERTRELQSTQRMLIRSEKLASVGRLAASIAHEINNPLMPIKILLDDMLEDIQNGIPADAYAIEKTLESVERIRRVVDKLLEFTGKSPSKHQDSQQLDVNRIIQNVFDLVRKTFEQEGKTITLDLGKLPLIYGDKDGLEQVFMNMALNACEAMTKGGTLHITSTVKADHVVVIFSDTGCGIPHDIIETIFEPFFSTKDDGNGLGLFVSYGIIQNHQGNIEVMSEVNKGTTFSVSLPLTDKALAQA